MKRNAINLASVVSTHKVLILFFLLLILSIFLRFCQLDTRIHLGWDEINNAWAAKNIIVDHEFPLIGFQAKLNSGIYIGPYYYYLIAIVYYLTDLSPIASGIMAGITGIFTFLVLFFISKKLFSANVALIAVFLNTVAFNAIIFDRTQNSVNFIPSISLIIFFSLYRIITGNPKFILLLSLAFGFFLHIHITAIFFPIIILFCLPFFPRTKETLKYMALSIPIFLLFIFPNIIVFLQNIKYASDAVSYGNTYFHGFHLRRVMQLTNDTFIQFEPYFGYSSIIKYTKFILIPLFVFFYLYRNLSKDRLLFCYLVLLWFAIPWLVFSVYSGEISDYYYSANKFIALLVISYLISKAFQFKSIIARVAIMGLLIFYMVFNLQKFFSLKVVDNLRDREIFVQRVIEGGEEIGFYEGAPNSYLYYYQMRKKGVEVY